MKTTVLAALAALVLVGCITEEELRARAEAEKAHQEQIAREAKEREELIAKVKEHEERLAKEKAEQKRRDMLASISNSNDINDLIKMVKSETDAEAKTVAQNRLRELIHSFISSSKDDEWLESLIDVEKLQAYRSKPHAFSDSAAIGTNPSSQITDDIPIPTIRLTEDEDKYMAYYKIDERPLTSEESRLMHRTIREILKEHPDATAEVVTSLLKRRLSNITGATPPTSTQTKSSDKLAIAEYMNCSPDAEMKTVVNNRLFELSKARIEKSEDLNWLASVVASDSCEEIKAIANEKIKEIKERFAAAIDKHYSDLAEHNYKLFLWVFETDNIRTEDYIDLVSAKWEHKIAMPWAKAWYDYEWDGAFRSREKKIFDRPWQRLVGVRHKLTEEEQNEGAAKLEEFGTQYLPNAYAAYEKVRDSAIEVQQMFNEEMPEPYNIKKNDPKYNAYTKLLRGLMNARTRAFRSHDELCHFYLLHKVGALSAADLAKIDNEKIAIRLYEENLNYICFTNASVNAQSRVALEEKARAFAEKQAPETYAIYQKCETIRGESERFLDELLADVRIMDITRFELPVVACREKIDFLTQTLNKLAAEIQAWHIEYKVMEKDAEAVAALDHETALKWKGFVELLPDCIKNRSNGPMIPVDSPMHKYYPNNFLCQWHLRALGIPLMGRHEDKRLIYDNCKIGDNRGEGDFPFFEPFDPFKPFLDVERGKRGTLKDRFDSITLSISLNQDDKKMEYICQLCGFYDRGYYGYSKEKIGALVTLLNEIDTGKTKYNDINISGINFKTQEKIGSELRGSGVSKEDLKGRVLVVK
ncbi:MAG: cell envelope integrity protein TolA [Kiritimatiellae bacterium]|nr:cell envelope integrity protein TolA [Kiritimatiellia bacterium]